MPVSAKYCQACIRSYARKWESLRERGRERDLQKYLPRLPCSHLKLVSFSQTLEQGLLELGQGTTLMPDAIKGIRWYLQISWLLEMVEMLVGRDLWRLLAQPPPGSHLLPTRDVGDIPQVHLPLSIKPGMGLP